MPGLAGSIMFPIAVFFMLKVYAITGRLSLVLWASCVAACFKALDVFIAPYDLFLALNPALAIICESLVFVLFLSVFHHKFISKLIHVFALSAGWKLIYSTFLIPISHLSSTKSFLNLSLDQKFHFFITDSLISTAVIVLFFKIHILSSSWPQESWRLAGLQPPSNHPGF
jgi:hypothetical protein